MFSPTTSSPMGHQSHLLDHYRSTSQGSDSSILPLGPFHDNTSDDFRSHHLSAPGDGEAEQDVDEANDGTKKKSAMEGRWILVFFLVLAILGSAGSGIYLTFAVIRFDWTHVVGQNLTLENTQTICALCAKLIETFFAASYGVAIAKYLCRAATDERRGVSFADLNMKTWVSLPGNMFCDMRWLKRSLLSFPGLFTLLATLASLLYTTAADALVSPTVYQGTAKTLNFKNNVTRSAMDNKYMDKNNKTLAVLMSSQGMTDFVNYAALFSDNNNNTKSTHDRPAPTTQWDGISVQGTWLPSESLKRWTRPVVNMTVAYPHIGAGSIMDSRDNQHLLGLTKEQMSQTMNISIAATSPTINSVCTILTNDEVYRWQNFSMVFQKNPSLFARDNKYDELLDYYSGNETEQDLLFIKLLRDPKWSSLQEFAQIFNWTGVYNRPGLFVQELHPEISGGVEIAESQTDWQDTSYMRFDTVGDDHTVVCAIHPGMVQGCTTHYHREFKNNRLKVTCGGNGPVTDITTNSYRTRWTYVLRMILEDVFSVFEAVSMMNKFILSCNTLVSNCYMSPSITEALSIMSAPLSLNGLKDTSMEKVYTTRSPTAKINPEPIPFLEDTSTRIEYTTYKSRGTISKWQLLFFVPLTTVCVQCVAAAVYLIKVLFWELQPDINEPRVLLRLGVATHLRKSTSDDIDEEFCDKWAVRKDTQGLHYLYKLRHIKIGEKDYDPVNPQAAGATDIGIFIPPRSPLKKIVDWFRGRFTP